MSTVYKVYFTPRKNLMSYGAEIDVSDHIFIDGIDTVKSSIDSTDYSIGVFVFGDINITGAFYDGYFGDPQDYRSIFKFSRDLCKVRIVFSNEDGDTITYRGLINEKATVVDGINCTIQFRVLSLDSVINTTNIEGGTVTAGSTAKQAFESILGVPTITSVLNFDPANINPAYDFVIDDPGAFDSQPTRDMINQLLQATNSILVIDSNLNIIVKSRGIDFNASVKRFYGPYDIYGRENVIGLQNFNNGQQRQFTSIVVNGQLAESAALIETFGYTQIVFTFAFITDDEKALIIAQNLLAEFSAPKMELELIVPTSIGRGMQLSDTCSINWPLRIKPYSGFLPVVGITKVGSATEVVPYVFGSFQITEQVGWKIIEITENPKDFTMILKLRQMGETLSDGVFNPLNSSIVGIAIVGISKVGSGSTDTWNPSVVGAGKIGATKVA